MLASFWARLLFFQKTMAIMSPVFPMQDVLWYSLEGLFGSREENFFIGMFLLGS